MPYTLKKYPPQLESLPKGAIKIWVETFNKVEKEQGEEQARKAAWRNVKLKYKKSGDKWVKRTTEANRLEITNSTTFVNLVEASSRDKGIFRVIRPGWSDNGFYYPKDVTPQLVPLIEAKPMFFNRHLEPKEKKEKIFGHQLPDAVAIAEKVWADENGEVFVELKALDNPNKWIFEAAIDHPEVVGNSIDARGRVTEGEAEGKRGKIVQEFVGYGSTDFVYRPAAGGKFISLTEATVEEDEDFINLIEATASFKEYLQKQMDRSEFWQIGDALISFLYALFAWNNDLTDEEKQKVFEEALNEFVEELKRIKPQELFAANSDFQEGLKVLKDKLGGIMLTKELIESLKELTPEVLKASVPTLFEAVKDQVIQESSIEQIKKEAEDLKNEVKELLEKVKNATEEKEQLQNKLKETEDKLKELQEAEEKREWENKVAEMLKEANLSEELITDTFRKRLIEAKSEEDAKELIEDRKAIQEKVASFDNPKPTKTEATTEANTTLIEDDDLLAKEIKSNY